jgi:hypothetical protein
MREIRINTIYSIIYQLLNMGLGLFFAWLLLNQYGSLINGLFNSIPQFINYVKYIEFGLGASITLMLFKIPRNEITNEIKNVFASAQRNYIKVSIQHLLFIIFFSFLFPYIIKSPFSYWYSVIAFILFGLYSSLDFLFLARYRIFLIADQKYYLYLIFSFLFSFISYLFMYLFMFWRVEILLVKVFPLIAVFFSGVSLRIFFKKKYKLLDYSKTESLKLEKSLRLTIVVFDIIQELTITIPLILLAQYNLSEVSVYSVYFLIITSLSSFISSFSIGATSNFGNLKGQERFTELFKNFQIYFKIISLLSFSFSLLFTLLVKDFIILYTYGVTDADYVISIYPYLFGSILFIQNLKIPSLNLIKGSGFFKEVLFSNLINLFIVFLLSLYFIPQYGLPAVLFIYIFSNSLSLFFNHLILGKLFKKRFFLLELLVSFILFISIFLITLIYFKYINVVIQNYFQWFFIAFSLTIFYLFCFALFYGIIRCIKFINNAKN